MLNITDIVTTAANNEDKKKSFNNLKEKNEDSWVDQDSFSNNPDVLPSSKNSSLLSVGIFDDCFNYLFIFLLVVYFFLLILSGFDGYK
jgi:hypothetical protein